MDLVAYTLFGANVAFLTLVWAIALQRWLRPWMAAVPLEVALVPALLLHMTRANGAGFLIEGVAGSALVDGMAIPAASGDIAAAVLAAICLLALRRDVELGRRTAWLFSLVGLTDLAVVGGLVAYFRVEPGSLGAMYFIVVAIVPGLLLTHLLIIERLRQASPS